MINDMLARGLSPKNARETFNNLNAAMKKAHVLKMVRENPCVGSCGAEVSQTIGWDHGDFPER